ncbi:MAG TPA: hypothetical protein VGC37_01250, partial [Friedmanniella sp.]
MPEEQPPADSDRPGSDWSWTHAEDAQKPVTEPTQAPSAAPATTATARHALPRNEDFRRTVGFTVLGTVVP